jgi:hypothetical protein
MPAEPWRRHMGKSYVPNQVSAVCGSRKVIWQWGAGTLRRFMGARQAARARLRALARRLLPTCILGRIRRAQGLWSNWRRRKAATAPGAVPDRFPWREGAVFTIDLATDPLEEHPSRVVPETMSDLERELHGRIRSYWESGTFGPVITLTAEEDEKVMENLRALGYVD